MKEEIKAIIVNHHAYYQCGIDCFSTNGKYGETFNGEPTRACATCEYNKFGSASDGGKLCQQGRYLHILQYGENENKVKVLAGICLYKNNLSEFSKYLMKILSQGRKSYEVLTKITFIDGFNKLQFSKIRDLTEKEISNVLEIRSSQC